MVTIDQIIAEKLNNWTINEWPIGNVFLCIIAMVLAVILCGVIGIERERRGRSAGLRTHLLVGVGSCLIMIVSIYGFPLVFKGDSGEPLFNRDVARLAAAVVTGVGFLGAGAIMHRDSGIKGLTTAATIWVVMAIGLACGSMNFILATLSTILIVVVLTLFRKFENRLNKRSPLIKVNAESNTPVVSKILAIAQEFNCLVNDLQVDLTDDNRIEIIFLAISKTSEMRSEEFVKAIESIEGVTNVSVLNYHKK